MVLIRLTESRDVNKLKYMSRLIFAALAVLVAHDAVAAQQVPGRDLLEFPLGLAAEAPALSARMPGGLWNPATSTLGSGLRGAVGLAGLTTPQEQGVNLQMAAGEFRIRRGVTGSVSLAQASVSDLLRTTTDPNTSGGEIPYGTSVFSLGAAAMRRNVSLGVAARYRWASLDDQRSRAFSLDAGTVVDRIAGTPIRVALSTLLFSPDRKREEATYTAAADAPVLWRDSSFMLRAGYSYSHTEGRSRDHYAFTSASYGPFDASGGLSRSTAYGSTAQRVRLGVGLRYASYSVAFGREDGAAGFGASYQVLLTRVIR
jgi:hypothetical protein